MGVRTESKEIADGVVIHCTTMLSTRSTEVLHLLGGAFGAAALKLLATANLTDLTASELNLGTASEALELLLSRLDPKTQAKLIKDLFETGFIERDGNKLPFLKTYETEFSGDLLSLYRAIAFAVEVNFGGFFPMLRAGIASAQAAAAREAAKSKSQSAPTLNDTGSPTA